MADSRIGIQRVTATKPPGIRGHKYGEFGPTASNGHQEYGGPTVHNGWTAEPARRSESDKRINRARSAATVKQHTPFVK